MYKKIIVKYHENIKNLPKITWWLQLQSVYEPEESQSGPLGTTEKHLTADMN